jgi:predicted permease
VLVVGQFALALAILVGAAVFLRRDRAVHRMDLGYRDGAGVLLAQAEMSLAGYADPGRWRGTIEEAVRRIEALPGVRHVALGSFVPLSITGFIRRPVTVPSYPHEPGGADRVLVNGVSDQYFELMGIPLLEGRPFDGRDTPGGARTVVVNLAFAERYFAGASALGKGFRLGHDDVTVVGVARNGRYDYRDIDNANLPLVYYSWRQSPGGFVTFHVRTDGGPIASFGPVRSAIHGVDPAITLLPPSTLEEAASVPFAVSRSVLQILAFLGAVALLLASMGLFAVVSYGASLRTRELGIRMALGATASGITTLVLRGALLLVGAGTAAGVLAALVLTGALRNRMTFLPDPLVWEFAIPALLLGGAAVVAGWLPARKAARVDPARTLRTE